MSVPRDNERYREKTSRQEAPAQGIRARFRAIQEDQRENDFQECDSQAHGNARPCGGFSSVKTSRPI